MSKSMSIAFDVERMVEYLDGFSDQVQENLRPAAAAGAKVLYDRVKLNVAGLGSVTGNLEKSIYRVLSEANTTKDRVTYHISWNHFKAPHGHLVEYGYLRRYEYYQNDQGQVRVRVRPGMEGKKKPGRKATPEQKAAYYVTLPVPIAVPGKAFVRSAVSSLDDAYLAAEAFMAKRLFGGV